MGNIVEYLLVTGSYSEDLNLAVNDLIKKGWQPFNGARSYSTVGGLMQTMVKYKPQEPRG